ncbi:MAG: signal recognition particle receptor subunit alpha, partial [Bacteroidales bacterium]|nr:signal recognition particle receptor subunit alpha [Bacteroidales bacterium]
MFENLSSKIEKALHGLRGKGRITDINIAETVKEVRKALLDADVSYPIAKEFTDNVKAKALGQNVISSVEPGQMMVKIVKDELTALMGTDSVDINLKGTPAVVLIAGLQGSGKTTFSAKLAYYLKNKKNKSVMLVAGDVYRPAAINQLQVLGEQVGVPVFAQLGVTDPVKIAKDALQEARMKGVQVVIVDTAG